MLSALLRLRNYSMQLEMSLASQRLNDINVLPPTLLSRVSL